MSFSRKFFSGNRDALATLLPGHLIILTAHSLVQSAADLAFPFRQDGSFWYFSGLDEPDLILTIDSDSGESAVYLPSQNDYQKEWDGAHNKNDMQMTSGVDEIRFKSDLNRILNKAMKQGKKIGYLPPLPDRVEPYGFYANPARKHLEASLLDAGISKDDLVDVRKQVARLRQVKQPEELQAIKEAINITGKALSEIKSQLNSFNNEKDIERALSAAYYSRGADGHAFQPIIANAKNAATIHYEKNNAKLQEGLILLDVGAQYAGYASDISRTWSIGAPSERQQELWSACLEIQEYAIALLGPGVTIREYQKKTEAFAEKQFKKLKCSMASKPFPHGFSHFMGIDVHDAGLYDEPLVPGSVITVEPGIYLPDEGIGMRVEDNVLITENGVEILSKNIPKLL